MKLFNLKPWLASIVGALLVLPTAYFIIISLMKYELGQPYLFDVAFPILERLGIKKSIGWNINLLILFGPVVAFAFNLLSVMGIRFLADRKHITCELSIDKSWRNLIVIIVSSIILLFLFAYALGENCRC